MTRANTEGFFSYDDLGVYGFLISPDFDTSQQMDISDFLKSIESGQCKAVQMFYNYNGLEVPIMLMGTIASTELESNITNNYSKHINYLLDNAYRNSKDIEMLKNKNNRFDFIKATVNNEEYLVQDKKFFFCEVVSKDLLLFISNPFLKVFKEDELYQDPKYKPLYRMSLKGYKKYEDSYVKNIKERQRILFNESKNIFNKIEEGINNNGFVIGSMNMFLSSGYAIMTGSKEDNINCMVKKVFPYKPYKDTLIRYSNDEINEIIKEKEEYETKRANVEKRLLLLEKLLKEKGRTWTIISKNKINFDKEDGHYSTWMNAQVSDRANYGWYTEKDFIDWVNMEGIIPFYEEQIKYFGSMLEKLSKTEYVFTKIIPKDKSKKQHDDYECLGVFKKDNKEFTLDILSIKKEIESYSGPIKKYTIEDFEYDFKKLYKKTFLNKIFNKKC